MTQTTSIAADRLKSFVSRIEKLEEEKRAMSEDIRDIFTHAKSEGFDPKIMRKVLKLRRMDKDARDEEQMLIDTYLRSLGDLPLFKEPKE